MSLADVMETIPPVVAAHRDRVRNLGAAVSDIVLLLRDEGARVAANAFAELAPGARVHVLGASRELDRRGVRRARRAGEFCLRPLATSSDRLSGPDSPTPGDDRRRKQEARAQAELPAAAALLRAARRLLLGRGSVGFRESALGRRRRGERPGPAGSDRRRPPLRGPGAAPGACLRERAGCGDQQHHLRREPGGVGAWRRRAVVQAARLGVGRRADPALRDGVGSGGDRRARPDLPFPGRRSPRTARDPSRAGQGVRGSPAVRPAVRRGDSARPARSSATASTSSPTPGDTRNSAR